MISFDMFSKFLFLSHFISSMNMKLYAFRFFFLAEIFLKFDIFYVSFLNKSVIQKELPIHDYNYFKINVD